MVTRLNPLTASVTNQKEHPREKPTQAMPMGLAFLREHLLKATHQQKHHIWCSQGSLVLSALPCHSNDVKGEGKAKMHPVGLAADAVQVVFLTHHLHTGRTAGVGLVNHSLNNTLCFQPNNTKTIPAFRLEFIGIPVLQHNLQKVHRKWADKGERTPKTLYYAWQQFSPLLFLFNRRARGSTGALPSPLFT